MIMPGLLALALFLWPCKKGVAKIFVCVDRGDAFGSFGRGPRLKEIGGKLMFRALAAMVVKLSPIYLIGNRSREIRGVRSIWRFICREGSGAQRDLFFGSNADASFEQLLPERRKQLRSVGVSKNLLRRALG